MYAGQNYIARLLGTYIALHLVSSSMLVDIAHVRSQFNQQCMCARLPFSRNEKFMLGGGGVAVTDSVRILV